MVSTPISPALGRGRLRGPRAYEHHRLHSEFKDSLGYMSLKTTKFKWKEEKEGRRDGGREGEEEERKEGRE